MSRPDSIQGAIAHLDHESKALRDVGDNDGAGGHEDAADLLRRVVDRSWTRRALARGATGPALHYALLFDALGSVPDAECGPLLAEMDRLWADFTQAEARAVDPTRTWAAPVHWGGPTRDQYTIGPCPVKVDSDRESGEIVAITCATCREAIDATLRALNAAR